VAILRDARLRRAPQDDGCAFARPRSSTFLRAGGNELNSALFERAVDGTGAAIVAPSSLNCLKGTMP